MQSREPGGCSSAARLDKRMESATARQPHLLKGRLPLALQKVSQHQMHYKSCFMAGVCLKLGCRTSCSEMGK